MQNIKYHTTYHIFKFYHHLQKTTFFLKYHMTLLKVTHGPFQRTTQPYLNVPHHPLQSTTSSYSKYHTTLFKVPHHPLQSTTQPYSKFHIIIFKVPHHPLQSTTYPLKSSTDLSREINTTSKSLSAVYAAHNNGVNPRQGPHQCALKYKPIRRALDKACIVRKNIEKI